MPGHSFTQNDTLTKVKYLLLPLALYFYVSANHSSPPRPDWDKCSEAVRGGMARWKELSEGKTSNDLVDVLLTEMASGEVVDTGGAEYFDGQVTVTECWRRRVLRWTGNCDRELK